MRSFHQTKQKNYSPSANIEKILSYVQKFNLNFSDVIDITRWGYFKLLGKGKLPSMPLIFKAKIFSKKATTKILKHGGTCIIVP
jgi:large subunit ribosomal protein L27Ae